MHGPTVGSYGGVVSYERGTPCSPGSPKGFGERRAPSGVNLERPLFGFPLDSFILTLILAHESTGKEALRFSGG